MIQLRIIGYIWLLLGGLLFGLSSYCTIRDIAEHTFARGIEVFFIFDAFYALAAFGGYGILRRRAWGRIVFGIAAVFWLLYAASYVLMVGRDFGSASLVKMVLIAVFTIYSMFVVFRNRTAA